MTTPDVIIVGYGAAGVAAALAASAEGAAALVLEKQLRDHHTPSYRMSGGMVMTTSDSSQAALYLDACAGGLVSPEVNRAWAAGAADIVTWLQAQGVDPGFQSCGGVEHPHFPGAAAMVVKQPGSPIKLEPGGGAGRALYDASTAAVESSDRISVEWECRGVRLIEERGRVVGVEAGGRDWRSRRGVILATGGFEMDDEMKRQFLPADPTYFYGNPASTGDGVRMALGVGADLWHMNLLVGRAIGHFLTRDAGPLGFILRIGPPGYVIVDAGGERFANEDEQAELSHSFYYRLIGFDPETGRFPRIPAYWLFDERRRRAGPLTVDHIGACAVGLYEWSGGNEAEIERGWIHRGSTVEEVAEQAGIADPARTARTVAEYNHACRSGRDALGRSPAGLVPLDSPPFYCVPLWPGGSNTSGGPRRNEHGQVLGAFGEPIPGLFAAGELGQAMGRIYPADGANLSEAFCFGRIAARSALQPGLLVN